MKRQELCPHCGSTEHALIINKSKNRSAVNFPAAVAVDLLSRNIDIYVCLDCGMVFVPREYREKLKQDLNKESEELTHG